MAAAAPIPAQFPEASSQQRRIFIGCALLVLACVMIRLSWVGYDGADDLSYAKAAEAWLSGFSPLGSDHWALRYTIVLPVALSLKLFGQNEFSLALPDVICFLSFVIVNFHFVSRFFGLKAGTVAGALLAVTPAFVVQATYIDIDVVEAFFVSWSFWLFVFGSVDTKKGHLFFWSGLLGALAFLTRETSCVLLLLWAGSLFLPNRPSIGKYALLASGFFLVVLGQLIYFGLLTGNPFYRYQLDAHHDVVDRSLVVQKVAASGNVLDGEGGFSLNVALDPVLMLFASQKYGLLFFVAFPFGFWLYRLRNQTVRQRQLLRYITLLPLLWIVFVSAASPILYLVPRYFIVAAWGAIIIIAYGYSRVSSAKWRKIASWALCALVATNFVSLYLENTNPRSAERSLVRYLVSHPGVTVYTDPDTVRRVSLLAKFASVDNRVSSDMPTQGQIYFYSPRNLELCSAPQCSRYQPKPGWIQRDVVRAEPRLLGTILRDVGLARAIPGQIMKKIEYPSQDVIFYQVNG